MKGEGVTRVDHIGVAVADLEAALRLYAGLGLEARSIEEVPTERVRVALLPAGESRIELLEPTDDEGAVARFLRSHGPGIHHIAFRVPDIEAAMARARSAGLRLLDEAPRPGAEGARVAFVHPKSAGGVLVELCQYPEHA
ncbi:MAG: methylmalonyl-CoA epimerase [Clostridia bacterium]|nr:methylmalonyl-CoA epimerase [Clostridia bacterium]